ncbi:hypothetical protein V1512DRAFT_264420 [Lipomyces arxii]|uniref:uncharacterized protein n=1 Tax=Lipomyces arxii TaxID=56418 RepID=UPI0034CEA385
MSSSNLTNSSDSRSPTNRRRSVFGSDVTITDPRSFAKQQRQQSARRLSISPTKERSIPLSASPASVSSSTLLDHRNFPAFSANTTMAAPYDTADDDADEMPLLGHEPAAALDRLSKQRRRRHDSVTADHDVSGSAFMTRDRRRSNASSHSISRHRPADTSGEASTSGRDVYLIDIGDNNYITEESAVLDSTAGTPVNEDRGYDSSELSRSRNLSSASLDDVCVPMETQEFIDPSSGNQRCWPDVAALDEWAESEAHGNGPDGPELVMVDGRPRYVGGAGGPSYYLEDNRTVPEQRHRRGRNGREMSRNPSENRGGLGYPYRFTYFREDLEKTIHSQSISGLLGHDLSFSELFPVSADAIPSSLAGSMRNSNMDDMPEVLGPDEKIGGLKVPDAPSRPGSTAPDQQRRAAYDSMRSNRSGRMSREPSNVQVQAPEDDARPYPFWLDILDPTDAEMKTLSKAFGIHPLTTEDICMEETREKVELFRTYYLVCFRSFELVAPLTARERRLRYGRDASKKRNKFGKKGELVPVNMYLVVFRDGILSFHYRPAPHPTNVRRRIRQLRDYVTVSADWICYAIIDNVTDGFAPLIRDIEEEVQDIDTEILELHNGSMSDESDDDDDSEYEEEGHKLHLRRESSSDTSSLFSSKTNQKYSVKNKGDMLRRIGECRKQVMSIMRLLGYKADVIKGFAKRCNEQWDVAPRSEIGLYLGDIQDHIVTMVQNLTHYEKLLSRSHSNYLAQINIEMTQVNNDTNDVLGRLTILGTIVLPMNIITGLWGMNVLVPGQSKEDLSWFYSITLGLIFFGLSSFWLAKKVYGIA